MSKRNLFTLILVIIAFILVVLLIFKREELLGWLDSQWIELFYAAIMAIAAGLLIDYIYRKYSAKSKMLQTTVTPPSHSHKSLAKLVLKEKQEFIIKEYERILGREDFVGVAVADDLLFIGKQHFKIIRMEDGFYIEDLKTKNGTMINGEEIKGKGKVKLQNGDDILVAQILKIKYWEEEI
jgi:pSer/pThr/pTyr-binding forkhead associated (FHA) protein